MSSLPTPPPALPQVPAPESEPPPSPWTMQKLLACLLAPRCAVTAPPTSAQV